MTNKIALAALFLVVSALAHGVECGPLLRDAEVDDLQKAVLETKSNLYGHRDGLLRDLGNALAASNNYEYARLNAEWERLGDAETLAMSLYSDLSHSMTLIQLRDVMRDKRDQRIVERFLSLSASTASHTSGKVRSESSTLLSRTIRAGIAVDMAKLRDVAARSFDVFGKCTAPGRT